MCDTHGIKLYKKLPVRIKNLEKFMDFKINLRTFLLNHSFYSWDEYFCFSE
jgi:hypothetical protein